MVNLAYPPRRYQEQVLASRLLALSQPAHLCKMVRGRWSTQEALAHLGLAWSTVMKAKPTLDPIANHRTPVCSVEDAQ
jgi:hypothetical protein